MKISSLLLTVGLGAALVASAGTAFAAFSTGSATPLFYADNDELGSAGTLLNSWGSFTSYAANASNTNGTKPAVADFAGGKWVRPVQGVLREAVEGTSGIGTTKYSGSGFSTGIWGKDAVNTSGVDITHEGFTFVTAIAAEPNALGSTDFRSIVNIFGNGLGLFTMDDGSIKIRLAKDAAGASDTYTVKNANNTAYKLPAVANGNPTPLILSMTVAKDASAVNFWISSVVDGALQTTAMAIDTAGNTGAKTYWSTTSLGVLKRNTVSTTLGSKNAIGLGSIGGTSPGTSTFRGFIGDTYVYNSVLGTTDLTSLQTYVAQDMGMTSAVPEPASILALVTGLAGIAGFRRRQK